MNDLSLERVSSWWLSHFSPIGWVLWRREKNKKNGRRITWVRDDNKIKEMQNINFDLEMQIYCNIFIWKYLPNNSYQPESSSPKYTYLTMKPVLMLARTNTLREKSLCKLIWKEIEITLTRHSWLMVMALMLLKHIGMHPEKLSWARMSDHIVDGKFRQKNCSISS